MIVNVFKASAPRFQVDEALKAPNPHGDKESFCLVDAFGGCQGNNFSWFNGSQSFIEANGCLKS